MNRMIGALTALVMIAGVIGWARFAGAQSPGAFPAPAPAPPPPMPAPAPTAEPPLAFPLLPSQPGLIVPIRIQPESPAAAPTVTKKSNKPTLGPTVVPVKAELPRTTSVGEVDSLITGVLPVPTEMAPGRDASNPTGKQEPAVSIEWTGPSAVRVGQSSDYGIVVRNTSAITVQQVIVRVRLAGQASVIAAEPKATVEDNVLMWDIGTLTPKEERSVQMRLLTPNRGDVAAQAWVTFTGATSMRLRVREPKLVVKAAAPERVMLGDVTTFGLTVANPGDGVAEQVKLLAELPEGLEHPRGKKLTFEVGNLNPGESRTVQVVCMAKSGGEQICLAFAEADAGLRADARAAATVMTPRLDLEVKAPKLRYLDRKAVYTFKVTNPGDAAAANVTLLDVVPAGQKVTSVDNGGRHDFANRAVTWFLGEIGPGQSREVNLEVQCTNTGEFVHKAAVQASRGLKNEAEATTRVEGLSAVAVELIDIEDPIEVNGEATYEVRVTNTGTKTESDVKLVCAFPADRQQFKTATGPSAFRVEGNEVVFEPLPKLAPRADAIYRVTVKCKTPGIANFKARVTSAILTDPVTKEEATRIYAD